MKIRLLVLHYKERYPGEYAPTVLLAADEHILDENYSWWEEAVAAERAKIGDEASAWAEVEIEVPTDRLLDALYPTRVPIPTTITATTPLDAPGKSPR